MANQGVYCGIEFLENVADDDGNRKKQDLGEDRALCHIDLTSVHSIATPPKHV